jgi:raffinose/stachyose/melibiose transport system permease protein
VHLVAETARRAAPSLPGARGRRGARPAPRSRVARGRRTPLGMGWQVGLSLLPGLMLFTTFFLVPLGVLVVTSFADWSGFGFSLLGFDNYREMLGDTAFWKAARNTGLYAAAGVFIQVPLGVVVGIILAQHVPGWRVFRAIVFIPFVISGAAYALVFSVFYNPRYGVLDSVLGTSRDWLFDTTTALPAVAATFVFVIGFVVVLVMAEIASIPRELYEAAAMDGASALQRHRHITVPLLRNVVGTAVLITLLGYLALFDLVYILTQGGPDDATVTLTLYAFRAYSNDQWGYANAVGVFVVLSGLLLIVLVRRGFRIGERDL